MRRPFRRLSVAAFPRCLWQPLRRLSVAACTPSVCGSLYAVCGSLYAVCGSLYAVRDSLYTVRGSLYAVCLWQPSRGVCKLTFERCVRGAPRAEPCLASQTAVTDVGCLINGKLQWLFR